MQAHDIVQEYLDRIAVAVMAGDWETYEAGMCLPFHLVTHTVNLNVTTQEEQRQGFDAFHQTLKMQKVTDFLRLVVSAQQIDEDLITGAYVTHLMSGAHRILPPFPSQITLRRHNDTWKAASITNALANSRWPALMPSLSDSLEEGHSK